MGRITVGVVGVKFKNDDGSSRQEILGKIYDDYWTEKREDRLTISLVAQPENEYDKNAVMVVVEGPEEVAGQIGHIPRSHAKVLQSRLDMVSRVRLFHMSTVKDTVGATVRIYLRSVVKDDDGRTYEFE